jgi:hypothetical protein
MPYYACFCCKRLALEVRADGRVLPNYEACKLEYLIADVHLKASGHVFDGQGSGYGSKLNSAEASDFGISQASYQRLNHEIYFKASNDALLQRAGKDTFDEFVWRQSFRFLYPECERLTTVLDPHSYEEIPGQLLEGLQSLPTPLTSFELSLFRVLRRHPAVLGTNMKEEDMMTVVSEVEIKLFSTETSTVDWRHTIYPRYSLEPRSDNTTRGTNERNNAAVLRPSNELVEGAWPRGTDELEDFKGEIESREVSMEDIDIPISVKVEPTDDTNEIMVHTEHQTPDFEDDDPAKPVDTIRRASKEEIGVALSTWTRKVICVHCGEGFSRVSGLRRHEGRHDKPYDCTRDECYETFGSMNDLKRHESTHYPQRECFRCDGSHGLHTTADGGCYQLLCCDRTHYREHLSQSGVNTSLFDPTMQKCYIPYNNNGAFWCGFCDRVVRDDFSGFQSARWTHIENHLR